MRMSRSRLAALAGAAVLLATSVVAGSATPASAALPGLERVFAAAPINPDALKNVHVTCPTGKQLVGATYVLSGNSAGNVVVDDFVPNIIPNGNPNPQAPTDIGLTAYAVDSFSSSWGATVIAFCVNPLPGLEVVAGVPDPLGSNDFHTDVASCPSGKVLTGSGYSIDGAEGEAVLDDWVPNGGAATAPTSVSMIAYEEDSFAGAWTLQAFAICANPVSGLVRVTGPAVGGAGDSHNSIATCTGSRVLMSAGFEVIGGTGEVAVDDLIVTRQFNANQQSIGVEGIAHELDPLSSSWSMTSYAVCANP
ncbi:hypothetical protein Aph01nite_00030 [Acrocarpospora phusangensis]|uniref:Secreted protein n=1 Tax=Acrocarpospora phusangensis TaxID=1070424 RepID=A0A919UKU9_9ACTN|nr:hypothetical protein [Acrocarpospora phusangensis]GIH21693.1 hypothetical protein Aph01nite_00030 [Acrocarpospora phusangensis]